MSAPLRYAFDLGTNSIGWAVYRLDRQPCKTSPPSTVTELLGCGVRVMKQGVAEAGRQVDGSSLAEARRVPRSARKRRDRFVMRRATLINQLVHLGLLPAGMTERRGLADLDPYRLRAKALDERCELYEIGRALLHINQRRGFRSNRRADRSKKATDEKGKIAHGIAQLNSALTAANVRTFGEFLWKRHGGLDGTATPRTREAVRIRLSGSGAQALYDIYPSRQMLMDEFDAILSSQSRHHPDVLTAEAIAELRETIFHQRPLKPVELGRCTLVPEERRLPRALPSVEARVIYETLNHLRYGEGLDLKGRLSVEHRDLLAGMMMRGEAPTFRQLRKIIGIGEDIRISLEDDGKKDLKDYAARSAELAFRKLKGKAREELFGERWFAMDLAERDAIVARLIETDDEDSLTEWLKTEHKLAPAAARAVAAWTPLDGHASLGPTANAKILAELRAPDLLNYNEAVDRAGWHHSDFRDGVIELPLPYYGQVLERHVLFGSGDPEHEDQRRYGRFPNPTAHIALNQLRRIVNLLEKQYGPPVQIVLELSRELKMTRDQKDEAKKKNRENRAIRDRHRGLLREHGQSETPDNFLRLRLYEEQERAGGGVARCPFSLKPIKLVQLFSAEIEIEHILPYSRTFDDSAANKAVCFRKENRLKRTKTPHEAWGDTPRWPEIAASALALPRNKRWRFAADAMQKFEKEERNFLARQLNETRHLSRMARFYLSRACDPNQVYVTTGQLTALLRGSWGLNGLFKEHNRQSAEGEDGAGAAGGKARDDHRHHAVDACVIGAIDRSLLQEMSRRAREAEIGERPRIAREAAPKEPFPGFRDAVRAQLDRLVVSLKPEHGRGNALHEETAYGVVRNEREAAEIGNLVYRKPLTSLTPNDIDAVRDELLRRELQALAAPFRDDKGKVAKENEKALAAALAGFGEEKVGNKGRAQGVRRVRIGKKERSVVAIKDRRNGEVYKALIPGENHLVDIVQMRDGTWQGFAASVFEVNQCGWRPEWEAKKLGGKLVMRLHKGDMIEVDDTDGARRIKTVHRIEISANRLRLAPHNEGGKLQDRHADKNDPFRWDFANIPALKDRRALKMKVDAVGNVRQARSNVSYGQP